MKRIAIIPSYEAFENNRLIDVDLNADGHLSAAVALFYDLRKDYEVHTYDVFSNLSDIDFFIMERPDFYLLSKLYNGLKKKNLIFIPWEPPVVLSAHSSKNLLRLSKYFKYILTWNDALIDGRKFKKISYAQSLIINYSKPDFIDFQNKHLLTQVSSNLSSNHSDELYSLRKRFNLNADRILADHEFKFYGRGWDKNVHSNYGGVIENKSATLSNFRFTLCFENMRNIEGYITEKIFDAFSAGVVPIYYGASNVTEYIPKNTFIDYRDFATDHELIAYIRNMPYEEWLEYIHSAQAFLNSDAAKVFSIDHFVSTIREVIELMETKPVGREHTFDLALFLQGQLYGLKKNIKNFIRPALKALKFR